MSARPLKQAEYDAILQTLADQGRHRDFLLVQLGCSVGYRISELLTLTVGQLWTGHAAATEVTVARCRLKGGQGPRRNAVRSRRVVLSSAVRSTISNYFQRHRVIGSLDEFAFRSRQGFNQPICDEQANRIIASAALAAGVDPHRISTHTLRKTFASRVHAATGDLLATQRLLAHSTPTVTALYLESCREDLDQIVLAAFA